MKKIGRDKWKHFWVGLGMGILLQAVALWFFPQQILFTTATVFVVVAIISYGFELYSKITGHGHHEIMDAIAAIIGGVLGIGLVLLFY